MPTVPLLQYKDAYKLAMIVYGRSGTGKSIYATSSTQFRTLVFDVDLGMTSVLRMHGASHGNLIDVAPYTKWSDFLSDLDTLVKNPHRYQVVVIDTMTELARKILTEVSNNNTGVKLSRTDHWGQLLGALEYLTNLLKAQPFHTIFLAHEKLEDVNGKKLFIPNFQGAFSVEYAKHFDVICRQFLADQQVLDQYGNLKTQTSRWLNCQADEFSTAKDRFMILDKYESPDYGLDYLIAKTSWALQQGLALPTSMR